MRKKIETPQAGEMYVFRRIEDGREGMVLLCSADPTWMQIAINIYKEKGRIWEQDPLPDDVELFEPTEMERMPFKIICKSQNYI